MAGREVQKRADDWWTGAPGWDLQQGPRRAFLEAGPVVFSETAIAPSQVDLARGSLSFRLDAWTKEPNQSSRAPRVCHVCRSVEEPILVSAPELLTEGSRRVQESHQFRSKAQSRPCSVKGRGRRWCPSQEAMKRGERGKGTPRHMPCLRPRAPPWRICDFHLVCSGP